jgi:hypothetical protein
VRRRRLVLIGLLAGGVVHVVASGGGLIVFSKRDFGGQREARSGTAFARVSRPK